MKMLGNMMELKRPTARMRPHGGVAVVIMEVSTRSAGDGRRRGRAAMPVRTRCSTPGTDEAADHRAAPVVGDDAGGAAR